MVHRLSDQVHIPKIATAYILIDNILPFCSHWKVTQISIPSLNTRPSFPKTSALVNSPDYSDMKNLDRTLAALVIAVVAHLFILSSSVCIHIRTVFLSFKLFLVRDVSGDFTFGSLVGGSDGDVTEGIGQG
jgi:hypothetical protein